MYSVVSCPLSRRHLDKRPTHQVPHSLYTPGAVKVWYFPEHLRQCGPVTCFGQRQMATRKFLCVDQCIMRQYSNMLQKSSNICTNSTNCQSTRFVFFVVSHLKNFLRGEASVRWIPSLRHPKLGPKKSRQSFW